MTLHQYFPHAHPDGVFAYYVPDLAEALELSLEEFLGTERLPLEPPVVNVRLWKRVQQIKRISSNHRKAILKVLHGFLTQYGVRGERRQ